MKQRGFTTVEAAMLFPMIFVFCMTFLQVALYWVTVEQVQAVCNEGILIVKNGGTEEAAKQYMEEVLTEYSLIEEEPVISVTGSDLLMFSQIQTSIQGTYSLVFPMQFQVNAAGYDAGVESFSRTTDLIWECASHLDEAKTFLNNWFGGE